ncbi:MAG: molecular chaperone DnaJ [Gammaproteobacteria bacterium RBG_16_57_12]|nr:MAG: molecular chaperone DnaJ [Gammaproteobacteria bacterium RBG_16_57_12]
MSPTQVIRITAEQTRATLSPAQNKFNGLIKKIDVQKKLLAEWQESLARCQQDALTKLEPLKKTLSEHQAQMVLLLDRLFTSHKFTHAQQEKLAHLICETCDELINLHQRDDLKPLYNKYGADDFDEHAQETEDMATNFLKTMMEEAFGVELGGDEFDFDPRDPHGAAERLAEKIKQRQERAEAARPKRKKTAKQLAKEAREQEETAKVSKSIQAVYRQLVAALHPDREPDPAERERKTELMQKVTVAYGNKDLLQLLELQLAVEQIDQDKLNNIAEDRLKHYNKILQNQLDELREEVMLMEMQIGRQLQVAPFEVLSPKRVTLMLKDDIRHLQGEIARLKRDLQQFQDVRQLKQWLKGYRIPEPEFDPFFEMMPPFGFR